ncbi:MAG: 23S rRNA (adenine(2503)-C(2))-methyltransferase RlmN [Clostridia bacterium]|nr:23S rRNA (adenine(2503)-C(2))-methyltransferase RlmN [Deltaproteobacteria bacterium]
MNLSLVGLPRRELAHRLADLGVDADRAVPELWRAIYTAGAKDLTETRLSKSIRSRLSGHVDLSRPEIVRDQTSTDGTRKWLIRLFDGELVETVYIPEEDRGAVCVSSQVGCTMKCSFCHTGTQPIVRNLTAQEIAAQVVLARDALGDYQPGRAGTQASSVVLMGMGEPLLNYDNVLSAIAVMSDSSGLAISKRKITLSTSGVVPMIDRLGQDAHVGLAISLHATTDALRNELVPVNAKWNIATLLAACSRYPQTNSRRILFEYVMLDGVNDSRDDAERLTTLLAPIMAKVNLIPFNPWPGTRFASSSNERIEAFHARLKEEGIHTPIRWPRGRDIDAACGQLKSASTRKNRHNSL